MIGCELEKKHGVHVYYESELKNPELYQHIPENRSKHLLEAKNPHRTGIRPDGGILMVEVMKNGTQQRMPILISENKKQGDGKTYYKKDTGKPYQAKGNVVERLAKNVIFFQTWLADEGIMPFVALCYGKDFEAGSSIIDRVATIAHYHPANTVNVYKDKQNLGGFTWFYKETEFTEEEIYDVLFSVAEKSMKYYADKYKVL